MASGRASANRANLAASRQMWSNREAVFMSEPEQSNYTDRSGICAQNSVQEWLITHEVDAKPDHTQGASSGPLQRNASSEDDLELGTEASLYGKQGVRTVQEFLRSTRSRPYFCRWNSLTSVTSARSAPLSVMDVLNLWSDDPEEVLLDLGFGCEEPDISGRIPARFINNKSSARGINIQVFLEAQKNRMDIENPDVSNRFRQLEVLQQVTTAFSALVGGASTDSSAQIRAPDLGSAETRERRKRMGMLLRRASRKTLQLQSQTQNPTQTQTQELPNPNPIPQSPFVQPHQPTMCLPDKRTPLKRARQCLAESCSLTSLVEEQGPASEASEPPFIPQQAQEGALRPGVGRDTLPMTSTGVPIRKRMPGDARESFEMEEIQSFEEGSVSESYAGPSDSTGCVMRTNSCQSDSSGFLEEPSIPSFTQHPLPGTELMKALSGMSQGSTESQITLREASLDPPYSSCLISHSAPLTLMSQSIPLNSSSTFIEPFPSLDPSSISLDHSPPSLDPSFPSPEPPSSLDQISPSLDMSSPYLYPSSFSPGPSPSLHPISPSLYPSFHSLEPSSPSLDPSSSFLDPYSPSLGPYSTSLDPSSPSLDSSSPSQDPIPPSLHPSFPSLDPSSPSQDPISPSLHPSFPSLDLSSPSLHPSSPSLDPSSFSLDHYSPSLDHSFPSLDPSSPSLDPSSSSLDHDSPLGTPSSPFLETTRSYPVSDSLDALEIINCISGAKPSLMEPCVTVKNGIPSHCGVPCHEPDSLSQHLIIVVETETENSTVGSGEAVPIRGKENDGEEHRDIVPTERQGVIDKDLDSPGSHEGSLIDPVILEQNGEAKKAEKDIGSSSEGPVLAWVSAPKRVDQSSEFGSVCHFGMSEDPLRSGSNLSEPTNPNLSTSPNPSFSSCTMNWKADSTENLEGSSSLVVQMCVPDHTLEPLAGQSSTLPSEDESSRSTLPASVSPTGSSSSPPQAPSFSPIPTLSPSILTTTPAPSSASNVPATQSLTLVNSPSRSDLKAESLAPVVPRKGAFGSCRSVSVQMPSRLSSVSCSALGDASLHTFSPRSPSFDSPPMTDHHEHGSFPGTARPGVETARSQKSQNTGVSRDKVTSATMPLPSPPSSNLWLSRDGPRRSPGFCRESPSLDKGLWQGEEEVVDEEEDGRWERALFSESSCCCPCHKRCSCCSQSNRLKLSPAAPAFPYSLDELEEMMCCVKKFHCVLTDIEKQLSENQASVYRSLSDTDRDEEKEVRELRRAVKQEAALLELQLTDLAHNYDDNFKMKMYRLLDEQLHIYTELSLSPVTPTAKLALIPTLSPASSRTVATQCCQQPWLPLNDLSDSSSLVQKLEHGPTDTKTDELDFVGFTQRVRNTDQIHNHIPKC